MLAQPVDYSRKWIVLASVAMGIFLATIDGSIVNVALPTLEQSFATHFATVQWVVLAYLLTVATLLLSIGRLADMVGKKPIYLSGFALFTAGSVLCALAWSIYVLIAFRVVQAIGAAMIMALGTAIVTEAFPATERGRALGISGAMVSIGIVTGPTLGGLLLDAFSWHWIFLVNLPVGMVGIVIGLRNLPDIRPALRQPFDFAGATTLFLGLASFLLALTVGQSLGYRDVRILGLLAGSGVALMFFLALERRVRYPMIDLGLFRNVQFSTNLGTGLLLFIATSGMTLLLPFLFQGVLQYDMRTVGLMMAVVPSAMGVTAPVAGALSDRYGSRRITVIGLVIAATGYLAGSTLTFQTGAAGYIVRLLPIGIGLGVFQSPNNSAIMGAVPRERLGIASGLLANTRTLGQVTGVALIGAFWASRVAAHSGIRVAADATQAAAEAQFLALRDAFSLMAVLVLIALALALRAWMADRRVARPTPDAAPGGPVAPAKPLSK